MKVQIESAHDGELIKRKRKAIEGLARTGDDKIEFVVVPRVNVRPRDMRTFGETPKRKRDRIIKMDVATLEWLIDDHFVLATQTFAIGRRAETVLAWLRANPGATASTFFAADHVEVDALIDPRGKPLRTFPREARLAKPMVLSVNVAIVKADAAFHYESSSWNVGGTASTLADAKRKAAREMWKKIAVTWDDGIVLSMAAARVQFSVS